jgi:phage/plasmid-associated DNA primase
VKKKDAQLGVVDLYERYQAWSKRNHLAPFSSKQFSKIVKPEIEIGLGLKYRQGLVSGSGVMRGWKGLAMAEPGNAGSGSKESGA